MDVEPSGLDAEPDGEFDSGIRKRRRGRTRGPVRHDSAQVTDGIDTTADEVPSTESASRHFARASRTAGSWFRKMDRDPAVVAALRRARRSLPVTPISVTRCPPVVLAVRAQSRAPPIDW